MSWFSSSNVVPTSVPSPDQPRTLLLYKYDACPYCQRVLRRLPGLDVKLTLRDTMMDASARDELVDATGRTQVPCLFVDGVPLLESLDILAWLEAYAKARHS